ncbi:MAG: putative lipid II flippase FtsW [Ruminococcaceae bacterium]|nr:putative lipid II flippase FtsW [Oscillospiraceae bacterium]
MLRKEPAREGRPPAKRIVVNDAGVIDLPYLVLTLILLAIGLVMLFSASFPSAYHDFDGNSAAIFLRQAVFALVGLGVMYAVSRVPYTWYMKFSGPIYLSAVVLLVAVFLFGLVGGGAKRWLNLGIFSFQPSEIAKVALIIFVSAVMTRRRERIKSDSTFFVCFCALGLIAFLLIIEPHFSATIIVCVLCFVMLLIGGASRKWICIIGGTGAALILMLILSGGYTSDRLSAWTDPFSYASDEGYQVVQSLYSIGSGGWLGLGFGMSRQKYQYLPEEHNDYIFAIICEELGFVGAILILVLFTLLILRGFWIAIHCRDRFSMLMASGLTTLLALQIIFNIAVVTNSLPSTGISLPLFSYGGTAVIMQLAQTGMMLNISRSITQSPK